MDEYYDDDFSDESWKGSKKKSKKLKTNPAGPFEMEIIFRGTKWDIVIENITINDFKVTAKANKKVDKGQIEVLKKYLQDEGFEMAAKKHNLFW
jgi:hypothetical protein